MAEKIENKQDEINWNDGMIYHNISINTHRWCVERAIRVKKGGRI